MGEALSHVLMASGDFTKQPNLALIISNATAGVCAQKQAWEYELLAEKARKNLPLETPYRIAEIKDNKLQAERWHHLFAAFYYAYKSAELHGGGGECPGARDETAFWCWRSN